jgi:microcystin-dependent protein
MPIDYPSSPTVNQIYTYNGKAWVFNGSAWVGAGFVGVNASSANTASYVVQRDASGNFSAGTITATLTGTATNVSGIVSLVNGGTGQVTANAGLNALLPTQASNSGKYLTSNGTNSSWGAVISGTTIPSASMQMFAGAVTQSASAGVVTTTAPSGWLLCDGAIVSRTTYSALWTALGTTSSPYGQGDGSTTFALPDMRSKVPIGVGTGSGLTARTLGGSTGTENTTLDYTQIPAHSHPNTVSGGNTSSAGSHTHTLSMEVLTYMGSGGNRYDPWPGGTWAGHVYAGMTISTAPDHYHTFTPSITNNNNTGGGGSHSNMQPSIGLNYIIKT